MRTEHVQGTGVEKVTGHQYLATYSLRNFFFLLCLRRNSTWKKFHADSEMAVLSFHILPTAVTIKGELREQAWLRGEDASRASVKLPFHCTSLAAYQLKDE
jgi:hypothetical protein